MSKQKGAAEAAAAALTGREAAMRTLAQYKRSFFDIVVAEKDQGVGRRFKRKRDMHEDTFFEAVEVKTHFTITGKARGVAYGYYTFRGMKEDVLRPIRSGCKKEWKMLPDDRGEAAATQKKD